MTLTAPRALPRRHGAQLGGLLAALQPPLAQQRAKRRGQGCGSQTETMASAHAVFAIAGHPDRIPQGSVASVRAGQSGQRLCRRAIAFDAAVEPVYRFDKAAVIVSLDADFMGAMPGHVRYVRDFAAGRRAEAPVEQVHNRLYAVESTPSLVGANADHRLPLPAGKIEAFARALAHEVGIRTATGNAADAAIPNNWVRAVARDLQAQRGAGLGLPAITSRLSCMHWPTPLTTALATPARRLCTQTPSSPIRSIR